MTVQEYKQSTTRDLSAFGAFSAGDRIRFVLRMGSGPGTPGPMSCSMVIHRDGWNGGSTVPHEYPLVPKKDSTWHLELSMKALCGEVGESDAEEGLFYYHYRICREDGSVYLYGGEKPVDLTPVGEGGEGERQLLVYTDGYQPSGSFGDGTVYHIFVDRFRSTGWAAAHCTPGAILDPDWENGIPQYGETPGADVPNNVFFGGDLYGVAEKLDYIAALGTGTVYLSPVFTAASNHKYDTGDYLSVDPMFGGEEGLAHLCREAEKRGIRILLDGVFNHTGADSIYFNRFGNYPGVGAWQSPDSPWAAWYTFQRFPEEYACWWGVRILPRVKSGERSFCEFICRRVIPKWMGLGVYGWRLDVADELDEGFLEALRPAVRRQNPDSVLIGEVWEDASDKVSYGRRRRYLWGRQLDGVMNYPLREAVIAYILRGDGEALRRGTEYLYRRYPKWASDNQLNFLGTHDTQRILTVLGGEPEGEHTNRELAQMHMTEKERETAVDRLKTAYGLLAAMPGVPCVFYGDEVGMEGYRDPFCRRPFPWHRICGELLEWYRRIGRIRKRESVLRTGSFRMLRADEKGVLYVRTPWEGEAYRIVVAVNRSREMLDFFAPSAGRDLITEKEYPAGKHPLAPGQVLYFRCKTSSKPWGEEGFSLAVP